MSDNTKEVSKSSYVWAHMATIFVHVLLAAVIIYYRENAKVVLIAGIVLLVMSLLAIIPILMPYDEISIS